MKLNMTNQSRKFSVNIGNIRLTPIWIYFRERGYTDEQIENLTLKEIEELLNEEN